MSFKPKNSTGIVIAISVAVFAMLLMLFQYLYLGVFLKKSFEDESREIALQTAKEGSQSVEVYFREALNITQTYAKDFLVYKQNKLSRATAYNVLKGSLRLHPNFLSLWTIWEPNAYDNNDKSYMNDTIHDSGGSFQISYYFRGNEIIQEKNINTVYTEDYYTVPKEYKKPIILDPYRYRYNEEKDYFETSLITPIIENNHFFGVIGIDLDLAELQNKFSRKQVFSNGYICILSNTGVIVTHKDTSFLEKNISEYTKNENISISDSLKSGREFSTESISMLTGEKAMRYYYPINIEYMAAPWYIMIEVPQGKIFEKANSLKTISLILLIASIILLSYLIYNISDRRLKEKKLLDNISQLELTELKLKKYQEHLEELVNDRTNEIQKLNEELMVSNEGLHSLNDQILRQKDELTHALEQLKEAQDNLIISEKMASLGVLSSGIAHEINNPLNFIQGGILGLETYFDENLPAHKGNVSPLIDAINVGLRRSANIVMSLSHYSRKDDFFRSECDIHLTIDNCITMLENEIRDKVKINKNYSETPYIFKGNEGNLHQAFLNILTNGVQAIETKGDITLTTTHETGKMVITIEDTGCGISQNHLDKIFDPFFTTKGPGRGTGLGLSIAYKIIKEHNGTIEFSSIQGIGTEIKIKLPVKIR